MAPVSKTAHHVTLSDGSMLEVNRDGRTPHIIGITPSESLREAVEKCELPNLRIYKGVYSGVETEGVPQFKGNETISLVCIDPSDEDGAKTLLFSGTIAFIRRT